MRMRSDTTRTYVYTCVSVVPLGSSRASIHCLSSQCSSDLPVPTCAPNQCYRRRRRNSASGRYCAHIYFSVSVHLDIYQIALPKVKSLVAPPLQRNNRIGTLLLHLLSLHNGTSQQRQAREYAESYPLYSSQTRQYNVQLQVITSRKD